MQTNKDCRIYSVHSQKGGVGKTSIALAIAALEAVFEGRKVLFIDADLTGTSVQDVLDSKEEDKSKKYFNKLLLADPQIFEDIINPYSRSLLPLNRTSSSKSEFEKSFCRQAAGERSQKLWFIPSDPKFSSINEVIPLISQEDYVHFFSHRIEEIIAHSFYDGFDTVIVDLHPGFYGFSKNICDLSLDCIASRCPYAQKKPEIWGESRMERFLHKKNGEKKVLNTRTVFVTTSDEPDYRALFPIFSDYFSKYFNKRKVADVLALPNNDEKETKKSCFHFFFNRLNLKKEKVSTPEKVMSKIISDLSKIYDDSQKICESAIYLNLTLSFLTKVIEDTGMIHLEEIPRFHLKKILSSIESLKHKFPADKDLVEILRKKSGLGPMERWCLGVGQMVNIF